MRIIYLITTFVFMLFYPTAGQRVIDSPQPELLLQPEPKHIKFLGKTILLDDEQKTISLNFKSNKEKKAANYFKRLLSKRFHNDLNIVLSQEKGNAFEGMGINLVIENKDTSFINDQSYFIDYLESAGEITISSPGLLGLLYGVVTCSEFFQITDNTLRILLYRVKDWPSYGRRIFPALTRPMDIENLFDFVLQNKMETVALASRSYPWYEVSQDYLDILQKIKSWKDKYGGPIVMQRHNIYVGKNIEISNKQDIENFKEVIETVILHGSERLMICADDTPPFEFGQGYVLDSAKDKEKFTHMAEAHSYLFQELNKWLQQKGYDCEMYYVPAFYTYEDAKYGDMFVYQGTPWEKDAFGPLKRDLNYIGQYIPEDVFVIWTGPNVRSRTISMEDLADWTHNLMGKVPFLWDNTIYSHHAFTSTPLFTAFSNDIPVDFHERTAGSGMLINSNISSEDTKVAAVTANDYLWNPEDYNADNSLTTAMHKRYGEKLIKPLLEFKEIELKLRRTIGERALWFQADTLWRAIVKSKEITGKNPFSYHINYSRLKALRRQLKHSVPQPLSQQEFNEACLLLVRKRNDLLKKIKKMNLEIFTYLNTITVSCTNIDNPEKSKYIEAQIDTIMPFENFVKEFNDSSKIARIVFKTGEGFLALDRDEDVLFTIFPFDNGPDYPSEGLFRIIEENKIGFANELGEIIIKPRFSATLPFHGGLAAYCDNCIVVKMGEHKSWQKGKWGFINMKGDIVIPAQYDQIIDDFGFGYARVKQNDSIFMIDRTGNQIQRDSMNYKKWVRILGDVTRLLNKVLLSDLTVVELKWASVENNHSVFCSDTAVLKLNVILKESNKLLVSYNLVPWQNFSYRSLTESCNLDILLTVTDFAVIYMSTLDSALSTTEFQYMEKLHTAFKEVINFDLNQTQTPGNNLNIPEGIQLISSEIFKNHINLQVAIPGSSIPEGKKWAKVSKDKMLHLFLVPDRGEIKDNWVKPDISYIDTYYMSVEKELQDLFAQAVDKCIKNTEKRREIFRQTKDEMRNLFSAANSYVNFLYYKYENRLLRWLILNEQSATKSKSEQAIQDHQPKKK